MEHPQRPFLTFLTDFGSDAAAAICRGVMLGIAPDAQIVDIAHSIRKFSIRDGAYLLTLSLPTMPVGVHVAVVDPGVGTKRDPVGLRVGRGDVLIGPDNGLLMPAARLLGGIVEARALENPAWMLERVSTTFHGRDIFSPMGAHVAAGGAFSDLGRPIDPASLTPLSFPAPVASDGMLKTSIIYIDSFGNLRLAGVPDDLRRAVGDPTGGSFEVTFDAVDGAAGHREAVPWVRTFGERPLGAALLYEDSFGSLAFADNQSSAAARLGAVADQPVRIRRA